MKTNFFKQYLFVLLIFVAFFDYDIFVILSIIYFINFLFFDNKIEFHELTKKVVYLQVSFFIVFIRFIPVLNSKFLKLYNNISQQNYLSLDGNFYSENVFLDLQTFLYGLYCNSSQKTYKDYTTMYEGVLLKCPFGSGYGYLVDKFFINGGVWMITLVIAFISLSILFYIFYLNVKQTKSKEFITITLFFLSPPVNFLIFRLNIDLIIFIFLIFFFSKNIKNKYIRNFTFLFFTFIKLYPILFLLSFTIYDILKTKKINQPINYLFSISAFYYLYLNNLNMGPSVYLTENQSYRSYGINNDVRYLVEMFSFSGSVFFVALIFIILIIGYLFFGKLEINSTNFHELHSVIFLLGSGIFVNYDYKLIFLFFLVKLVSKIDNKFINIILFLFIFSSPTLLHAYEKYYKLIVNDEIFILDFSFYFVYALCTAILYGYLRDIFRKIKN